MHQQTVRYGVPVWIRKTVSCAQFANREGAWPQCATSTEGNGLDAGRVGGQGKIRTDRNSLIENNRANPTLYTLEGLAAAFKIPFVALFETT